MVERSTAWLTHGNRKLRCRGVANNDVWLHHRIAAHSTCAGSSLSASPDETGPRCWPELNAAIEDRLTAQHRERDISPKGRTHLVVAHADQQGRNDGQRGASAANLKVRRCPYIQRPPRCTRSQGW